jgi:hypothetical protein
MLGYVINNLRYDDDSNGSRRGIKPIDGTPTDPRTAQPPSEGSNPIDGTPTDPPTANRPAKEAILFMEPQRTHRHPNRPDCGSHWVIKSSHFLKGAWAKISEQMVRFLQWGFLIRILARDFSRHCQGIRLGQFKKCMGATNHSARAVVWLLYDNIIGR